MVKVKHWCWNYYTIKKDSKAYCNFCSQSYEAESVQRMLNHILNQCKKIPSELRESLIINDNKDKIKKSHFLIKHILLSLANSRLLFFNFVMQILGYYFLILSCKFSVIIF